MKENVGMWYQAMSSSLESLLEKFMGALPSIVAAIFLLLIGYFIAKILRKAIKVALVKIGIEKLANSSGINDALKKIDKDFTVSSFIAHLVFWIVLLVFFVSAADSTGMSSLSETIDQFISFIPKIIAATLILLLGLVIANFAKRVIYNSASSAGFDFAKPVSNAIYALILVLVISLTIGELEIETRLLDLVITVIIASLGIAVALSLGLGSRGPSENVLYSIYIADTVSLSDRVELKDGTVGTVAKMSAVSTVIELDDGSQRVINNRDFLDGLTIKK